jgi:hypothetical protein
VGVHGTAALTRWPIHLLLLERQVLLEQLAAAEKSNNGKKAGHLLGDRAGNGGGDAETGEQTRRRSSRATKKPEREGQIWLEAWNSNGGIESATEPKATTAISGGGTTAGN